jgi:hypothetical protein
MVNWMIVGVYIEVGEGGGKVIEGVIEGASNKLEEALREVVKGVIEWAWQRRCGKVVNWVIKKTTNRKWI